MQQYTYDDGIRLVDALFVNISILRVLQARPTNAISGKQKTFVHQTTFIAYCNHIESFARRIEQHRGNN